MGGIIVHDLVCELCGKIERLGGELYELANQHFPVNQEDDSASRLNLFAQGMQLGRELGQPSTYAVIEVFGYANASNNFLFIGEEKQVIFMLEAALMELEADQCPDIV